MATSHPYSDLSAGFFRYQASDGTHSHIHRIHTSIATIDNTTDPGSPSDGDHLIHPESDVNATARNFLFFAHLFTPTGYTLTLLDFQPVSGGRPTGPPDSLLPYSLSGIGTGSAIPEAEVSYTFRCADGSPLRYVFFGGGTYWAPTIRYLLTQDWIGTSEQTFAAYVCGLARTGGVTYSAGMTNLVSHHSSPASVALARVSGLNGRLRRAYRVK